MFVHCGQLVHSAVSSCAGWKASRRSAA